jgi:hypothetical protein
MPFLIVAPLILTGCFISHTFTAFFLIITRFIPAASLPSCKLYTEKVTFGLLGDASQVSSMQFPASEDLRRQLMLEFLKSKRPQKVSLQLRAPETGSASGEAASSSTVYLVPTKLCNEAVALDFLALCASPPVEGGGLRSAESRLEPLLLPTNNAEHSAHVLSTFEKKVQLSVD